MHQKEKAYLGDAVYARIEYGSVWLTTEDGIRVTNEIFLEPQVYDALLRFVERAKSGTSSGATAPSARAGGYCSCPACERDANPENIDLCDLCDRCYDAGCTDKHVCCDGR